MALTLDEVLERARRMLDIPTLYWIGKGGQVPASDAVSPPGDNFNLDDELARLPADKLKAYRSKAEAAGLDPRLIPPLKACDCSGFVWWALRQTRDDRNTDWMWRDAVGARSQFELFDREDPLRGRPGAIVVYPKPPAGHRDAHGEREDFGHVGIVTAVDAQGHPTRVIHCSADNFLARPAPGPDGRPRERNGIAETGPEKFLAHAGLIGFETRVVWHTRLPR